MYLLNCVLGYFFGGNSYFEFDGVVMGECMFFFDFVYVVDMGNFS